MNVCPYCQQDDLWRASIAGIDSDVVICRECDTVWMAVEEIVDGKGITFEDFMMLRELAPDWKMVQLKVKFECSEE